MKLNGEQLGKDILTAFKGVLENKWPEIKYYGEAEAKKLVQSLIMIEALIVSHQINKEQAALHVEIQKNSTRIVLLTLAGLDLLVVEAAINTALDVVKDTVNQAVGFALL